MSVNGFFKYTDICIYIYSLKNIKISSRREYNRFKKYMFNIFVFISITFTNKVYRLKFDLLINKKVFYDYHKNLLWNIKCKNKPFSDILFC